MRLFTLFLAVIACNVVQSFALEVEELKLEKSGAFQLDGVSIYTCVYSKNFERTVQRDFRAQPGFPRKEDQQWSVQSVVNIPGEKESSVFIEEIRRESDGSLKVHATVEHPETPAIRGYFLEISVPVSAAMNKTYQVDSLSGVFPAEFKQAGILEREHVTDLSIPSETGVIRLRGNFFVLIQDNRAWKSDRYLVRIGFTKTSDSPYRAELEAQLQFEPSSH